MTSDHDTRSRQYQDALYEALAGPQSAVSDADPLTLLDTLVQRCRPLVIEAENAAQAIDALAIVAHQSSLESALSSAAIRFESPQRFREALYFARCLERDAAAALDLLSARGYLDAAVAPAAGYPDLATDQAALLDSTTFGTLWSEPGRRQWFLDMIDIWKRAYMPVYTGRHATFNAELAAIAQQMDTAQSQAIAVERLNGLQRLGPPQAVAALTQFHELERLFACPADETSLGQILAAEPICPYCAFRLGETPPTADARRVLHALERGLAAQQARLAQRVVSRLLARPGRAGSDRLDRFIEVVQASDLAGLAAVLDDGLMAFLRDLLESPEPATTLVDQLARSYPEITAANLEDAVGEFRLLLRDELERQNGHVYLRRPGDDA
jgi:hypothetical protein